MTLTGNSSLIDPGFDSPPGNPLLLLKQWLDKAEELKVLEPRGFVLATVDKLGHPSSMVVLLKDLDDKGVIFSCSSISQKGRDLADKPFASGTLWWRETMQQVNFSGSVTILPDDISDAVFNDRTIEAKAVAVTSSQSELMDNEANLRAEVIKLIEMSKPIYRPKTWNAYHVLIHKIEFCHGSLDRFHRRLRYNLVNKNWQYHKLQP